MIQFVTDKGKVCPGEGYFGKEESQNAFEEGIWCGVVRPANINDWDGRTRQMNAAEINTTEQNRSLVLERNRVLHKNKGAYWI